MTQSNRRNSSPRWPWVCLSLTLASLVRATAIQSATHRVPEDFKAIQAAIAAASSGDTILVGQGLYDENLDARGKFLTLIGVAGASATIVDGGRRGSVLQLDVGGIVEGFTFRRGQAHAGGGVSIGAGPGPTIVRNNIVEDNLAGFFFDSGIGGGVYIENGARNATIAENTIIDNYAGDSGGGIYDFGAGGENEIRNNLIARNGCHVGGGGVSLAFAALTANVILENWSDSFGGGVVGQGGEIRSNTIVRNFIYNTFQHGAGIDLRGGSALSNIVVGNHGPAGSPAGAGILCRFAAFPPRVECNDAWGNAGGDFAGDCDTVGAHNFSADPLFCNPSTDDFHLYRGSPCAPGNNPECGLVGALPVDAACKPITTTRRITWGMLKRAYR